MSGEAGSRLGRQINLFGLILLCTALIWVPSMVSARNVYRFVDQNGVVNLTDRRPPPGVRYQIVMRLRARNITAPDPATAAEVIRELERAARRHGVDVDLVKAIAKVESNYNPRAISPAGAKGVMQLVPATARRYGVKNIFDIRENVDAGVRYFRDLLKMFNGDVRHALAGYNAGEGRVLEHGGIPPIPATRQYVDLVVAVFEELSGKKVPAAHPFPRRIPKRRIRKFVDARGIIHLSNR